MGKWPLVRLGDVCEIGAGQGAPQGVNKYCRQGTPFIKAGNLADLVNGCSENEIQQVNDEVAKEYALRIYPKGTIVFAKSGMSCMKGYVYKLKKDCYVVNHLACVIPRKVYGSYLKYCLEKYPPNRLIKDASYPSISLSDIANLKIPLPPFNVQKYIANVLDKTQEIIDGHKKQLAELDNLIKSVFYEMFGDPGRNEKNWEVVQIKDLAKNMQYGTSKKASTEKLEYPILRMNNITYSGEIDLSDLKYINLSDKEKEKYLVYKGEMLFNRTNSKELVGKSAPYRYDYPMAYAGYLIKLTPNEKANSEFISAFLNSKYGKALLESMAKNIIGMANINAKELGSIRIYLPPIDLQNKFADIVTKIEEQKALVKQAITESEHLFNSLMSKYFD